MSSHEVRNAELRGFYFLNPSIKAETSLNNGFDGKQTNTYLYQVNQIEIGQQVQDIETESDKEKIVKPKSRKKLAWILVLLLVLSAGGGGAWFYFEQLKDETKEVESEESKLSKAPKLYFPLDAMVINLADIGGERFAQVGITFQIREAKSADDIKKMLPTLRSAILMSLSQKTSEELLSRDGKEKLAIDILSEVGRVFGVKPEAPQPEEVKPSKSEKQAPKSQAINPVLEVLFSSMIIQ
jgi:flagellar FliL protein